MNQETYDLSSPSENLEVERLYERIMAIPKCEQFQDCGFISRIADSYFVVSIFTDNEEFSSEFSTQEDYFNLDGKLMAYEDAMRYADYVALNENEDGFNWDVER